ncbi:(2Fe-2S)-binding protein [Streptomyces radicis]|uniref:(2Fe-2S)-binding protein n=1 Tax=Streptomyces radicis TaxID=1750517 RepID=A0A3A9WI56_9ACTN|nr:(2Fe-2S)-binding protein [Streptomyces radicis]RKN12881.1 (2Fe-2S)-binding protein [Streptomyces radicis]RKN27354.1 (2Fe-2S)-binding protein [Streptomyces radicis]
MNPDDDAGHSGSGVSRRGFLGGGVVAAAAAAPLVVTAADATPAAAAEADELVTVRVAVNGDPVTMRVDPRATLLDTLRDKLELTGTKKGCDRGQCGACTVHVDGRRVLSCLTLAATTDDRAVTTIEGLADGDRLHPMQEAFIEHDGFQCGFCTPGQIMSAVAMVDEGHAGSDDEIREGMSGNICRCSAYPSIVSAIKDAREAMR